jgi:sugar phosphate isomerase/epimerase
MDRLSLNTATTKRLTLPEAVQAASDAGLTRIGLWRDRVEEVGLDAAVALVRDSGLAVSSLCRGGFLTAADPAGIAHALADNRTAIEQAAALGAPELVLVVGGLPDGDTDLTAARGRVADRLADLVPVARDHGVRLALEPLHPMYVADRAVLSTLGQALDLALAHPSAQVGVVVDTFHVWWDPALLEQIARAGDRIASYQVCDYLHPLPADVLLGRGMMGDGVIDFPPITRAVAEAGYTGDVEVEIFNADIWAAPAAEVLTTLQQRFADLVLPALTAPGPGGA